MQCNGFQWLPLLRGQARPKALKTGHVSISSITGYSRRQYKFTERCLTQYGSKKRCLILDKLKESLYFCAIQMSKTRPEFQSLTVTPSYLKNTGL
eukprot:c26760_g1_i1 orf=272-556(+)